MKKVENKCIAFLDVLVERRDNGKLGDRVYRKSINTDRYLSNESNHHPKQKQGIFKKNANIQKNPLSTIDSHVLIHTHKKQGKR